MIRLNNLTIDFAGNIILHNVSLQIKKNDKVGLIGNNGAGKTTLLNLLSKKITPTFGTISEEKGITTLSIWTCEISEFDWEYSENESCYLLEGEVEVITNWEKVNFGQGDFVQFPKGLKCVMQKCKWV